jgi:hypothetical protein
MSNISSVIKSIQDIMRQDSGVDGDAQRISQLTWLLFLKVFDAFMVALPPLVEQTKIVTRVNELRSLCVDLRKKVINVRMVMGRLSNALIFEV